MKMHIFDDQEKLNNFLANKKSKNTKVEVKSFVVGEDKDGDGVKFWRFVDRFFVTEE